jgi:thiazole synthase
MELGADGVLLNTAVAQSRAQMASAMKLGVQAGRLAYLAGRMEKILCHKFAPRIELVNYFKN